MNTELTSSMGPRPAAQEGRRSQPRPHYTLVDRIDGGGHIEQVSVAPEYQGQGIGRALIEHTRAWAASNALPVLTLTTSGHVPWNRPLYEHLGFRVMAADALGPGLRRLRNAETAHGLDPDLRVVMRIDLP